jgi:hypothetical protein
MDRMTSATSKEEMQAIQKQLDALDGENLKNASVESSRHLSASATRNQSFFKSVSMQHSKTLKNS